MSEVIYEVRIRASDTIADAYRAWLNTHMQEMLALPGFRNAECCAQRDAVQPTWVVRYTLDSHAALDAYLSQHAPVMRARVPVAWLPLLAFERSVLQRD